MGLSHRGAQTVSCHPGVGGRNKMGSLPPSPGSEWGERTDAQATGLGQNTAADSTSTSRSHPSESGASQPTYPLSGGTNGPSATRLSTGTSFAFFTSRTGGSLGASRALRIRRKEKPGER